MIWIKVLAVIVALSLAGYGGYQFSEGKHAKMALKAKEEYDKKVDELATQLLTQSAEFEEKLSALERQKGNIEKIVEKEIEKVDYRCVLPDSGVRDNRTILESLKQARAASKSSN